MWMKASRFCICRASSRSRCVPIAFSCRACLKRAGEREKNAFHGKKYMKAEYVIIILMKREVRGEKGSQQSGKLQ